FLIGKFNDQFLDLRGRHFRNPKPFQNDTAALGPGGYPPLGAPLGCKSPSRAGSEDGSGIRSAGSGDSAASRRWTEGASSPNGSCLRAVPAYTGESVGGRHLGRSRAPRTSRHT